MSEADDKRNLKLIYSFVLGLMLVIFVGFGISTFYETPQEPEFPKELEFIRDEPTEEQIALERQFEAQQDEFYEQEMRPYNRNVSIITFTAAVIFLVVSLVYEKKIQVIADGVMLGGLFTLLYGLGRGFASEDNRYIFVMVTVGLAVVLFLGYRKFVKPESA
ncbi:MAG: hypothetical protein R3313_02335 [Candidatus Saccharimonadales bacterium]|nr:hypothetical protein [Candidatus Saccharimonadales bacterium]